MCNMKTIRICLNTNDSSVRPQTAFFYGRARGKGKGKKGQGQGARARGKGKGQGQGARGRGKGKGKGRSGQERIKHRRAIFD